MAKKLRITQVRSGIGMEKRQRVTVRTMGIRKLHQTVVHDDTPQIRGMIAKVRHLVRIEEIEE